MEILEFGILTISGASGFIK